MTPGSDIPGFEGDTSRETLRVQFAALRRIAPSKRLSLMDDLTAFVRSLTRQGLRRRHPERSEAELELMYFQLVLGRDLAAKVLEHRLTRSSASET